MLLIDAALLAGWILKVIFTRTTKRPRLNLGYYAGGKLW